MMTIKVVRMFEQSGVASQANLCKGLCLGNVLH